MVNNNNNLNSIIKNKKPVEIVQEIENEIPSFEEFMKNYEVDKKINESYENEIASYGDIRVDKRYGPTYYPNLQLLEEHPRLHLNSTFRISYRLNEGYYSENKRFFKFDGKEYSNTWIISGKLDELCRQQGRIRKGEIKIFKSDYTERDESLEEEVKRELANDIERFSLAIGNGERISPHTSGEFQWHNAYNNVCNWPVYQTTSPKK